MEVGSNGEDDGGGVLAHLRDRRPPGERVHRFGPGAGRPAVADLGTRRETSLAADAEPGTSAPALRQRLAGVVRELVDAGAGDGVELFADAQRGPHEQAAVPRQAIGERGDTVADA